MPLLSPPTESLVDYGDFPPPPPQPATPIIELVDYGDEPPPDDPVAYGTALFEAFFFEQEPWREQAQCAAEGLDTSLFFPEQGQSHAAAKECCMRCPVRIECDDFARRSESTDGIWGGVTRQRGETPRPIVEFA